MLGGLARWLRMLGYDTEYDPRTDDNILLQNSMSGQAILLTRDQELHQRALKKGVSTVFVVGDTDAERLAQLARVFHLSLEIDMGSTKCPVCGTSLREIGLDEASRSVPPASIKLYDRFWKCSNVACGKTYWVGGHWKKIRETLEQARKLAVG